MLRWGILGTSFISETMAAAIASGGNSRIVAVSGRDPGRLADFAGRHGIDKAYASSETLLDDPDVDVVYIGLPNNLHGEVAVMAAQRGKAILSEKSLTTSMADADALARAVRSADVFFMEGLMYLCHPLIETFGEIIRSGRLGAIRSVNGVYAADIWKLVNPLGKGTIFNLGCYPVSLLQYVVQTAFGPDAFGAHTASGAGNVSRHDDNICDASLSVRFSNGMLATLQSTDSYGMMSDFSVYGDRGMARFLTNPWLPVAGKNAFIVHEYGAEPEEVVVETGRDAFQHQVERVEQCLGERLLQPRRPAPRLSDSLEIMSMLAAWEQDCRTPPPGR
ncbi:MAG: putative oxidoreductase [Proteobacteria bacterium]|nr:putative oxidoreductase [Pseudomonadota bacterium]